jgi:hypothetical protein
VSQSRDVLSKFDEALKAYTTEGFTLCKDSLNESSHAIILGPGLGRIKLIKKLAARYPLVGDLGRKILNFLAKRKIYI